MCSFNSLFSFIGKLSFWSIAKLLEFARFTALKYGFAHYKDFHSHSTTLFVASQRYEFTEDVHDIRFDNAFGLHHPLHFYMYVSDAGKSSFCTTVLWTDPRSTKEMAKFVTKVVVVKIKTRKPFPLEDFFYDGLEEHLNTVRRLGIVKRQPVAIPDNVFRYKLKALHSDTDNNAHVNQASYVKWCSDAASVAATQKHLTHFQRHIELYACKTMELHYTGESVVNDELEFIVWEEGSDTVWVSILCKGDVIFTMDLQIHEGPPVIVSPHLRSLL